MTLPVVFTANGPSGYNLTKSLRFRSSASAYLNRTPASAGSRTTWTISAWVKRGTFVGQEIINAGDGNNLDDSLIFNNSSPTLNFYVYNSGFVGELKTTAVYRDPSAWYHIVAVWDTTQATASNRMRLYVNGSQVTAFGTANYPSQNAVSSMNNSIAQNIGRIVGGSLYFDGYMAEINFIDGQALTPSSFGSTNALTGVWQPAKYTGTYGTNGFYLPFTNTTSTTTLGYDFSGNSNNWTTNNLSLTTGSTYDSMTDVPTLTSATTANYCVMNPLGTGGGTLSNGNLDYSQGNTKVASTIGVTSGKWYCEAKINSTSNRLFMLGVAKVSDNSAFSLFSSGVGYYADDGTKYVDGVNTGYGATFTAGDTMGIALNLDAGTVTFYKNNTSQGAITLPSSSQGWFICAVQGASGSTSATWSFNFGAGSGFTYTPPTGFVALNTYNLPTSTIVKGNTVMDATLYTGNGSSPRTVTGLNFQPDFVWIKDRSNAYNHTLWDSVRGVGSTKGLSSNSTDPEGLGVALGSTSANGYVSALNSNGFQVTTGSSTNVYVNTSPDAYVAWQWQAGQGTTSSNTNGSITSTVSVNASAGFSVVQFTATGSNATVGHGLGVAPAMVIVKDAASTGNWAVYHQSLPSAAYYLYLNTTAAQGNTAQIWNSTAPTSSVFSIGTWHTADRQIAYCWSEIAGFSKFGSYTGNGSTDGTFVYTGFRPKYVMVKRTDSANAWVIYDTVRDTSNVEDLILLANDSGAESSSSNTLDIVSNGFKLRSSEGATNGSGGTYIYMAFAENPFKNALAR